VTGGVWHDKLPSGCDQQAVVRTLTVWRPPLPDCRSPLGAGSGRLRERASLLAPADTDCRCCHRSCRLRITRPCPHRPVHAAGALICRDQRAVELLGTRCGGRLLPLVPRRSRDDESGGILGSLGRSDGCDWSADDVDSCRSDSALALPIPRRAARRRTTRNRDSHPGGRRHCNPGRHPKCRRDLLGLRRHPC